MGKRWPWSSRSLAMGARGCSAVAGTPSPVERSHVPTRDRRRGTWGLRAVHAGQQFVESVEAFDALRRGTVKLRPLVPSYRPPQASRHEVTRAIVEAIDVLGAQ